MAKTEYSPSIMERLDDNPRVRIPAAKTHFACQCYQSNKNPEQIIRQRAFAAGKRGTIHSNMHNVVFVQRGAIRISTHYAHEGVTVGAGELFFLPLGAKFVYEAMEDGALLILSFDKAAQDIPECHTFRFQRDNEHLTAGSAPEIYPLRANARIIDFFVFTLATLHDGLRCSNYARLQVTQLMVLIQVYYTQAEYTRFYSAILSGDVAFSDFIYRNCKELNTARRLAEGLHMTEHQFMERFRKTFGVTPGSWLQQRKRGNIYQELCSSTNTLKDIAFRHGFSMPNFVRYCRSNYGQSPGAIRRGLPTKCEP